jgi:NTE family protein
MSSSNDNVVPKKQRALILGGGGALGAYEAGAINAFCNNLVERDKKNGEHDNLLFDVIAGTSMGAMNGAVLVSQFLQTGSWEDATESLIDFWADTDKGLASNISSDKLLQLEPWLQDEEWYKKAPGAGSKEAARKYYSANHYIGNGAPKVHNPLPTRPDFKFFDDSNILVRWFIHSNQPLQDTIQRFADFPIATRFCEKQPRLLVFSVDVLEGQTVAFDSYEKADGVRKSEYGQYIDEDKGYEHVIKYRGITLDHVMASGTLPEFYDYARVPTDIKTENGDSEKINALYNKTEKIDMRYFWDGGLLSNTPFRELLQAHEDYWVNVQKCDKIPDLEVYLVNLHPSKIDSPIPPMDHDGVKGRQNDIIFCDRSSHHDESIAHLISNYKNLVTQMKDLTARAISKSNDPQLQREFENILRTPTTTKESKYDNRRYEDLLKGQFKLTEVFRVERKNDADDVSGKTADFTHETIKQLIEKGERDAMNIFI